MRAQPDGYTLLCNTGTVAINPSFYPNLPFNPLKALTAVVIVVQSPNLLVVHPSVPVRSVRELLDLARDSISRRTVLSPIHRLHADLPAMTDGATARTTCASLVQIVSECRMRNLPN